jgi:two-component system, sensor histidine kinase and response regulator
VHTLPGEKVRINAAQWVMAGYAVFTLLGTILHVLVRVARGEPLDVLYIGFTMSIGGTALYSFNKLAVSLSRTMRTFAWIAMGCITGLLIYALEMQKDHMMIMLMFHVGIFTLGLILGFRPALYYALAASAIIVITGLLYRFAPAEIVLPLVFIFALTLPARVVDQLIAQSTAELAQINLQLEELVEERTAELRAEIAERRHTQDSLSQRTLELEKRNEELDAYAHTVAHDLKAPLASVVGFSDLLEKRHVQIPPDKLTYYCSIIAQNGRKMVNIIDALLLMASVRKIEDVPVAKLDLPDIMGDIQSRFADVIAESKAEIIVPERWPVVLGYQPWVEEILANYVSNAIKYGGIPPRIEVGTSPLADGRARFWVRDNGKGLTPDEQALLFTPFTRLDQVRVKGYGLGLSIVQRIAEKINEQVGVESEVGQGSTFYLTLPLAGTDF